MQDQQRELLEAYLRDHPDVPLEVAWKNLLVYGNPAGCRTCDMGDCPYHVPQAQGA